MDVENACVKSIFEEMKELDRYLNFITEKNKEETVSSVSNYQKDAHIIDLRISNLASQYQKLNDDLILHTPFNSPCQNSFQLSQNEKEKSFQLPRNGTRFFFSAIGDTFKLTLSNFNNDTEHTITFSNDNQKKNISALTSDLEVDPINCSIRNYDDRLSTSYWVKFEETRILLGLGFKIDTLPILNWFSSTLVDTPKWLTFESDSGTSFVLYELGMVTPYSETCPLSIGDVGCNENNCKAGSICGADRCLEECPSKDDPYDDDKVHCAWKNGFIPLNKHCENSSQCIGDSSCINSICVSDCVKNSKWPTSKPGTIAEAECIAGFSGFEKRRCMDTGEWEEEETIDKSACVVHRCKNEDSWNETPMGSSYKLPCGKPLIGYRVRQCLNINNQAIWDAPVDRCNRVCLAENGFRDTPAGIYATKPCPGHPNVTITKLCTDNGVWGRELNETCFRKATVRKYSPGTHSYVNQGFWDQQNIIIVSACAAGAVFFIVITVISIIISKRKKGHEKPARRTRRSDLSNSFTLNSQTSTIQMVHININMNDGDDKYSCTYDDSGHNYASITRNNRSENCGTEKDYGNIEKDDYDNVEKDYENVDENVEKDYDHINNNNYSTLASLTIESNYEHLHDPYSSNENYACVPSTNDDVEKIETYACLDITTKSAVNNDLYSNDIDKVEYAVLT